MLLSELFRNNIFTDGTVLFMLAFLIYPFVQALIIILFFVLPLKKLSVKTRILLATVFGLGSLKIYIYLFTGGTLMDPKLTRYPAIISDCIYFSSIFLCIQTLLRMLINVFFKLVRWNIRRFLIPSFSTRYAVIMLVISCFLGITGVINGFAPPEDITYSLKLDRLPEKAEGFKIIHLADLHISAPATVSEIEDIVRRANIEDPDLIVITGDFIDGDIASLDHMTRILFKLKSRYGVYAVSGNHEFYSGYTEWLHYFSKGGISFLENSGTVIRDSDGTALLNLCGLIDLSAPRYGFASPDIREALKNTNPLVPTVFLTHQPKIAHELKEISALTLAGHTHGGLMPGLKQIVAAANGGLVSGYYALDKEQVIVTNGTRIWAGVPLRLNTPSQLVKIVLK